MSEGKIQIMIQVAHPEAGGDKLKPACKLTLEDRVHELIECIESGYESKTEWLLLNKVYNSLQRKKQSERVKSLKKMIEPVLAKYGYHKVTYGGKN